MKRVLKRAAKRLKFGRRNRIRSWDGVALSAELVDCDLDADVIVAGHAALSHSTVGFLSAIGRYTKVTHTDIGKFCAISWDCSINAVSHPYTRLTVSAFPYVPHVGGFAAERVQEHRRVEIGHDVWVGANAVILPGIRIGHGAVVGAGAVVTKDVAAYEVVAGVPARTLRYRFPEEIRARLLALQWWNWPRERLREHLALFRLDVDAALLDRLEKGALV
jgi:acetyltransferase-like isoleucine patch superfamily enzyme